MKLGWIDFLPEDRKRAIEALNALNESTEDELGTGVIRDAFAGAFFPGTSTLHTRAKYFILIPCAIRMMLERFSQAKKPLRALEELRKVELECARQMCKNSFDVESQGIIGRQELDKAGWIVRAPSEIYWAGLRTFGISSISTSIKTWIEKTVVEQLALETEGGRKHSRWEDEDGVTDDADTQLADWKADFIIDEDIFQDFEKAYDAKTLRPELTQREADFLHDKIRRSTPGSLLEFFLSKGGEPPNPNRRSDDDKVINEEQTSFFQFAESLQGSVSSEMDTLLAAACEFNRFNFAANVLYNKMLGIPEAEKTWNTIRDSVPDLRSDLSSVRELSNSSRISSAVQFLNDLQEAFQGGNFTKAERRIRERERLCSKRKAKKAKLDRHGHSEDWVGVKWHDFRLANAARILNDITHPAEDAHEHV